MVEKSRVFGMFPLLSYGDALLRISASVMSKLPMSRPKRRPVFWSFRRCPYAMRARLAVCSAGIQVELREILLRDKPDAFLQASPKGTVPVVELVDGTVLEESRDVMQWALAQNDPDGWLEVQLRHPNRTERFLDALDGPFKTHLDRYKYASRFDVRAALEHRTAGAAVLAEFDASLASQPTCRAKNMAFSILLLCPLSGSFALPILSGLMHNHGQICITGCRTFWKAVNLRQ